MSNIEEKNHCWPWLGLCKASLIDRRCLFYEEVPWCRGVCEHRIYINGDYDLCKSKEANMAPMKKVDE